VNCEWQRLPAKTYDPGEENMTDLFRIVALVVVAAGTMASEVLVIRAGGRSQPLLSVLFIIWILLPFVALAWANVISKSWPAPVRISLYFTTIVIALGSIAFYGGLILPRGGSPRAFVFVMGPLAAWAVMLIVVPTAAAISRRHKA
jgi:hypothetical protein